jgi:superfamily I DNA/RNA helicase
MSAQLKPAPVALNPQQQAVVDWVVDGRGSLNLIARAGCGKTFTLIQGVVRTVVEHELGELAIMAYNKSAADEFKHRITRLQEDTGDARFGDWRRVQAGTVHSFGFGAVRQWSRDVKVDDKKVYGIIDRLAQAEPAIGREAGPVAQLVSLAKQSGFGFLTAVDDAGAWFALAEHHAVNDVTDQATMDEVVRWSQKVLRASFELDRETIDFDDMVLAPLVHNLRMWPKDWVLIDEAQDTNAARRALAFKMLRPRTGRLVAVGDDRQAIYGFTGADSDALELIQRALSSVVLPLTVTYRCPKAVVAEANRLVPDLEAHPTAPEGTVRTIVARAPTPIPAPGAVEAPAPGRAPWWFETERPGAADAVLCRNTKPLLECAYTMLAAGVGCRVEGRDVGEGLIKLARRWKRVTTLEQLRERLVEYRDREVQKWQAKGREDRAQAAEDKVDALTAIMARLVSDGRTDVAALVSWIRDLFGDTQPGVVPKVVTLSTVHKAKGREWTRVYVLSRSTTMPSRWARKPWQLLQEANLEYVAVTRAMKELVFVE